jgi:hypothetical protein
MPFHSQDGDFLLAALEESLQATELNKSPDLSAEAAD